ncbi:helix-turn-helix domain-containing protein [Actinacidiphila glaucinigra]|uniref:helix-turn-helix domain-containing protein n=1 Tax=Actinacidiphila glaucinigra TaxID=235986 RepID=UPI0035DF521F
MSDLFDAVDALLSQPAEVLPSPEMRARLREADGLTQRQVAEALGVTRLSFLRWETGQATPHPRRRAAYLRLLNGWAAKHPSVAATDDQAKAS